MLVIAIHVCVRAAVRRVSAARNYAHSQSGYVSAAAEFERAAREVGRRPLARRAVHTSKFRNVLRRPPRSRRSLDLVTAYAPPDEATDYCVKIAYLTAVWPCRPPSQIEAQCTLSISWRSAQSCPSWIGC